MHKIFHAIIDLPMLADTGMKNCQGAAPIKPNDLLQKAVKLVYANPLTLFENQIYAEIFSVFDLLNSIATEQVDTSGFEVFVNTTSRRQQNQNDSNRYETNDIKNIQSDAVNNKDDLEIENSVNQSIRRSVEADSYDEIKSEQQSRQAEPQINQETEPEEKPEKKRIWLIPANE